MSSENTKVEKGNNSTFYAGERELEPIIDEKKQARLRDQIKKRNRKERKESCKGS